jgi:hypothetical protein
MLMPLSVAAACSSKLKPAEAFAEGEAPGLVKAASEGSVEDELHAAALVKEAFGDDSGFGGNGSEYGAARDYVDD